MSGGFTQVLRTGQSVAAVPYIYGATFAAIKAPVAAATATGVGNPTQGVMQYGTVGAPASHGLLLSDVTTPANVAAAQRQLTLWIGAGIVADGGAVNGYPLAPPWATPIGLPGLLGPEVLTIYHPVLEGN